MQLSVLFSLLSVAFAFSAKRTICTPTQLRNAALNLTLEYQGYIAECNFPDAQELASVIAVGRTNQPDCPQDACCQNVNTLGNFNMNHYGECEWDVEWINATPAISGVEVGPCGDVSVFASTTETNVNNSEDVRNFNVEFVWRPRCGVTGCVANCALELVDIKYANEDCESWDVPLCIDCQ